MSNIRTPLLVIGGGCAAMLAAAVGTVAMTSFYADMPEQQTNVASGHDVAPKVVKTIKMKPETQIAEAVVAQAETPAKPPVAPAVLPAAPKSAITRTVAAAPTSTTTSTTPKTARAQHPVDINAKLESAFAAQEQTAAAKATDQELGKSADSFADLVKSKQVGGDAAGDLPQEVAQLPSPAPRVAPKHADDEEDKAVSGRTISMRAGVNMRAAGKSGSRVIMTVPAGAKVTLAPNCEHWCKISYNGRTGYVYRSFINGGGKATRARARAAEPRKAEPAPAKAAAPAPAKPTEPPKAQAGLFGNGGIFGGKKTQGDTVEN